jgi:transposase
MPGTVRKIIERIKEQRAGGNSVVALTVETRLVLQGFDPQRFDDNTSDDPGRLARIQEIAGEMSVDIDDLLQEADVAPDPEAEPAPPPGSPSQTSGGESVAAAAQAAAQAAGITATGTSGGGGVAPSMPSIPDDHPLRTFKELTDEALEAVDAERPQGEQTGASFERLIKSSLLIALYSFASDRVFLDQLRYHGLFQWFMEVEASAVAYDAEAFSSDREEVLGSPAARQVFDTMVPKAGQQQLFSSELLQVNGRLIKSWMTQRARA